MDLTQFILLTKKYGAQGLSQEVIQNDFDTFHLALFELSKKLIPRIMKSTKPLPMGEYAKLLSIENEPMIYADDGSLRMDIGSFVLVVPTCQKIVPALGFVSGFEIQEETKAHIFCEVNGFKMVSPEIGKAIVIVETERLAVMNPVQIEQDFTTNLDIFENWLLKDVV